MILKAIDPGVHQCAVAYGGWCANQWSLVAARFEDPSNPNGWATAPAADVVVVEQPQVDGRKINPQTFIDLTRSAYLLAGRSAGRTVPVVSYTPRQWKRSIPKPSHHALVIKALDARELQILADMYSTVRAPRGDADWRKTVEAACKKGARDRWRKHGHEYYPKAFVMHNILDAVALFLHHVGRLRVVKGRRR